VQDVLRRYLSEAPAKTIDIGGATGVHASWLADSGYSVQEVDIAPRHVDTANADFSSKGVKAQVGETRNLTYPRASFDAALRFGRCTT
jgi:2-polyprenyl-3-methyl-5-hydroxy-6-metoxy-1,4-benzoquinol methylase